MIVLSFVEESEIGGLRNEDLSRRDCEAAETEAGGITQFSRSSGDRVIHSLSIAAGPLLVGCRVRDARSRSLCAMFSSSHSVSFASTRQRLEARTLRKACFHAREPWR
ncbi:unnamed protein product [Sphagnum tenellum]